MDDKPVLISKDGLRKLEEEYEELTGSRRREVAERIRHARDFGDIAENAEYIEAKNEQSLLEGRIQTLEAMLRNATLIEEADREQGVVTVGTRVRVTSADGEEDYAIVGAAEADPIHGMISNESPLGRALLGHRSGDEVEWSSPMGTSRLKIVAVK
ncbi:MAG TPA: transcription elongation factor GreA [Candidatus Dormibacteraeota bacterium]